MKRLMCVLLCVLMLLSVFAVSGCKQQPVSNVPVTEAPTEAPTEAIVPTEPEETVAVIETDEDLVIADGSILFGVDISNMDADEAYVAICEALSQYTLSLTVNGRSATLYASEIELGCSEEEVTAYLEALEAGVTPDTVPALTYNTSLMRSNIAAKVNVDATNATVKYSSSLDCFQISSESAGYNVDVASILEVVKPAVEALASSVTVTAAKEPVEPTVTSDDPKLLAAVEAANAYLDVSLTYSFTPEGTPLGSETIPVDTIGSFITFDSSMNPTFDEAKINTYATNLAGQYGVEGEKGKFKTTGGSYINITVTYSGPSVDIDGLATDIRSCLQNKLSGTRTAPYVAREDIGEMPYGGTYIEINLSSQSIWMYKSGKCIVSGSVVSGCVYDQNRTPTGLYSIQKKSSNTYLVGETYSSYVRYWMPFAGAIGLHDASWRGSFGGDIYLYEGSHGCVNLPTSVAATIFNNCTVGTKVIVYGGASKANPVTQEISGTTSYTVDHNSPSFTLDTKTLYGDYKMTYTSSDPSVVEVSADGVVTVKNPGTATITVYVPAKRYYTEASLTITVTVKDPCNGNHTYGDWTVTKEATCAAGEESRTCSVCGKAETRAVDPVQDHYYGEWATTKEPTCTAGEQTRTCSVCQHTETQSVDPIQDHTYGEWVTTKEPTCTAGEQTRTCSVCQHTETQAVDPVQDHAYGEWTTTKETSCGSAGEQSCSCSTCGHTKTESIPKTEHDFSSGGQYCGNGCGAENPAYVTEVPEE